MKQALLVAFALLGAATGPAQAGERDWSEVTAFVLPSHRCEVGIFHPLRCGVRDRLDLGTHPLLSLLIPNASIKVAWAAYHGWAFSTFHELAYPTPLLRALSHRGAYALIPADAEIPHLLAITSLALFSRKTGEGRLTLSTGLRLARAFGTMTMPTIDVPIVFPRTSAYHKGAAFQSGLGLDGPIRGRAGYMIDADLFVLRDASTRFHFESKTLLTWRTRRFAAEAGFKFVYGQYPFGPDRNLLPWLDLKWSFGDR